MTIAPAIAAAMQRRGHMRRPMGGGPEQFAFGNAIELDGNDFLFTAFPSTTEIDDLLRPGDGTKASWTFWLKDAAGALGDATQRAAFGKSAGRYGLQKLTSNNDARFMIGDGTNTLLGNWLGFYTDIADTWAHIAAVWDASQGTNATKLKLYKNGALVTADSFTGTAPAALATATTTFDIGNEGNGGTNVLFGAYDEFSIHSVALTAAEVLSNYNRIRISRGIVERWKMDEGSGTTTAGMVTGLLLNFEPFGGDPAWITHT